MFKKLKLTNPEVEGGMILLSPSSELKLKCNRYNFFSFKIHILKIILYLIFLKHFYSFYRFGPAKVTYKIMPAESSMNHSPVASVDSEGNLVASSKTGSTTLFVTAVEEFGVVQQLSIIVRVMISIINQCNQVSFCENSFVEITVGREHTIMCF